MPDQLFQHVHAQLQSTIEWTPLIPGSSNQLYRGLWRGRPIVLRINAPSAVAFGVDRQREASLLSLIQPYRWSPNIIINQPDQGWCLMAWHGSPPAHPLPPFHRQQLITSIADMQCLSPTANDQAVAYDSLLNRYQQILHNNDSDPLFIALHHRLTVALSHLPKTPVCLTHHDLHMGNLCWDNNQLVIIDWEYAAFGNPWFDAIALRHHFEYPHKSLHTLPAFRHLHDQQFRQGLLLARWIQDALEVLWYAVRENPAPSQHTEKSRERAQKLLAEAPHFP